MAPLSNNACDIQFRPSKSPSGLGLYEFTFSAMASPCQVLIEGQAGLEQTMLSLGQTVATEAWRIEHKYSRYRDDNLIHQINQGLKVEVDNETAALLDFAQNAYELSDGLFDVSSGILRRIWDFKGLKHLPSAQQLQGIQALIGWQKVNWAPPFIQVPQGMEIDLGGIGKEYAVDKCRLLLSQRLAQQNSRHAFLINFGGDLAVSGPRQGELAWATAIENPAAALAGQANSPEEYLSLKHGAITTSGNARQHIMIDGKQYGHILNPTTAMPVENPPLSVTVAAPSCLEAGLLSTLAMLQGPDAQGFLEQQEVDHWVKW